MGLLNIFCTHFKMAPRAPTTVKFVVDFSPVAKFKIDMSQYEKFLNDRIKVEGKVGQLGDKVSTKIQKDKVIVTAQAPFSKRYLKYLTKKYLKANEMRDFMRVVASDAQTYQVKLYNVQADDEE